MANSDEITKVLGMLNAAYPRFKLTEETITVYVRLLGDLSGDDLQMAAVHCATNRDFFPSVHELRQAVVELKRKSSRIPGAYEAWIEVSTNRRERWSETVDNGDGAYAIVERIYKFTHPLVEKVAREMGWPKRFPTGNEMSDRSHFVKAYEFAINDVIDYGLMLPEVKEYIDIQEVDQLEAGNATGTN